MASKSEADWFQLSFYTSPQDVVNGEEYGIDAFSNFLAQAYRMENLPLLYTHLLTHYSDGLAIDTTIKNILRTLDKRIIARIPNLFSLSK